MTAVTRTFSEARSAAFVFFIAPGLAYGLLTARLPLLKAQCGASAGDLGFALLMMSAGAVAGLLTSNRLMERIGSTPVLAGSAALSVGSLVLAAFASSVPVLTLFFALTGFFVGVADVAMNALGITIERRYERAAMNGLHASYSFGGFAGSAAGSLFAALGAGALVSFLIPAAAVGAAALWAGRRTICVDLAKPRTGGRVQLLHMPLLILLCAFFAFLAYASEGVCGDWGNLFLITAKGAPESAGALVYGFVAIACLASRISADPLRAKLGNANLVGLCSLLAGAGFLLTVLSSSWELSLAGFVLAGLGLGPVVPSLFSAAGSVKSVSSVQASFVVSLTGYTGLLVCPALFGHLAEWTSLSVIYWVSLGFTAVLAAGSRLLAMAGR